MLNKEKLQKIPYIIAEIGMNHDGSFGNAIALIEEAKNAGADAIKFQLHIAEAETLKSAPTPPYFKLEGRFEYFKRTAFSLEEWLKLKKYSRELGLDFIVSPFSQRAAEIMRAIEVDAYKIASGEATNLPLLEYIAAADIPVFASTGMNNWQEIEQMVKALGSSLLVLFQCSSQYPCQPESVGLNIIKEMRQKYPDLIIGFSDHTLDNSSAIAALLFGARVFEKHFTLSKIMYGPDAKFSLTPKELKQYANGLKFVYAALTSPVDKNDLSKYQEMKTIFEKSITASRALPAGKILERADLDFKKPGNGLRADKYKEVLGKTLRTSKQKDDQILFSDIQ